MGKKTNYDDKFDDVMHYVTLRLNEDGQSTKVQNKEDLRAIFKRLDEKRRDKEGSPRLSENFIDRLLQTRKADAMIGRRVGQFTSGGAPKRDGKERYSYSGGTAVKFVQQRKSGAVVMFRDAQTGRFIKKSSVK